MNGIDPADDRILVAYADGELGVMESLAVEAALERDPALREKVGALRETAALLRDAYAPLLREVVPIPIRALVEAAPVSAEDTPGNVIYPARFGWRAAPAMRALTRIAAALALVVAGAAAGWVAAGQRGPSHLAAAQLAVGQLDAAIQSAAVALVQRTLENRVSGASDVWRDPGSGATLAVTPVRTFKDGDDRYCREYRETVSRGGEQVLLRFGVACRDDAGHWKARFHVIPGDDPPDALVSY